MSITEYCISENRTVYLISSISCISFRKLRQQWRLRPGVGSLQLGCASAGLGGRGLLRRQLAAGRPVMRRSWRLARRGRPVVRRSQRSAGRGHGTSASARAACGSVAQCAGGGDRRRSIVGGRRRQNTLLNEGLEETGFLFLRGNRKSGRDFWVRRWEHTDLMMSVPPPALSSPSGLRNSLEASLLVQINKRFDLTKHATERPGFC
jgi:hypothetical protein